jgi:hypothetical protein
MGCLTCVAHCPERGVLAMQPVFWKRPLAVWVFPSMVVLSFLLGIGAGMVSGHWHGSLSFVDYQQFIPLEQFLIH